MAWLKPHKAHGALYEYAPVHPANGDANEYSEMYYQNDRVGWESHSKAEEQSVYTHIELYEWHMYTFSRVTTNGSVDLLVETDGE